MESSTQFELEAAISTWRSDLRARGSLGGQDLEELESHLRESIEALTSNGLSEAEAFLIAERRLGEPSELGREFQKANPGRVWGTRICWMLVGYLCFTLIGDLAVFLSKLSVVLTLSSIDHSYTVLANTLGVVVLAAVWCPFLLFLFRRHRSSDLNLGLPIPAYFYTRPLAAACTVAGLFLGLRVLSQGVNVYFARALAGSRGAMMSEYMLTQLYAGLALTSLLLMGATITIHRLRKRAE